MVPCSSAFRDAVQRLATKRGVSPADLARSVLLIVSDQMVKRHPDPGNPAKTTEAVQLQSGASVGRTLRRKPRLQMRLPRGYDNQTLRKALSIALAMAKGDVEVTLVTDADRRAEQVVEAARDTLSEENETLRRLVKDLSMPS